MTIQYNGATIYLPEDEVEEGVFEYLDEMADHPLFNLDEVSLMPDSHIEPNSRTIIGFTMPFREKLSPAIIGMDPGCGMLAVRITGWNHQPSEYEQITTEVRNKIPMSTGQYDAPKRSRDDQYHLKDDFPYDQATEKLQQFMSLYDDPPERLVEFIEQGGYSFNWVTNELAPRIGISDSKVINGIGTLGGGNHFIELSKDESGAEWLVCHSGSRGVGGKIHKFHMDRAHKQRQMDAIREQLADLDADVSQYLKINPDELPDDDLYQWVHGGMGESFYDKEAIRSDYEGEEIERVMNQFSITTPDEHLWDYLEGDWLYEYYIDMLFTQVYATENRKELARSVIESTNATIDWTTLIDSPHNLLDFSDGVIRKGATSAHRGEIGVIPFNMEDGAIIYKGLGNSEWNNSVSHGAGRPGSRGDAIDEFESDSTLTEPDVFTSGGNPGEYPHAYKDQNLILDQILGETVTQKHRLTPFLNFKG